LSTANFEPIKTLALEQPASRPEPFLSGLERASGLLLLTAATPVTAIAAITITALSRRSPFVAHLRVGKDNQPFWMWKLRTMWDKGDSGQRGLLEYIVADPANEGKPARDSRVTSRFAAFCRRHSIDELPQLWNVVRGEMSLVGPRPLTRSEVIRYYGANAPELLSVKPGLTGLWQVSGRSHIRFPHRAMMDLALVRTLTPRMYVTILLQTIVALVSGNGAW